jgi:hypothetical protein
MQYFLSSNILNLVVFHLPSASQEVLDLLKKREREREQRALLLEKGSPEYEPY